MTTTSVTSSTASGQFTQTTGNTLFILNGGIVSAATIDAGAFLTVSSGGEDFAADILSGASATIAAHDSATGDQIFGTATVSGSSAAVTSETVESGGLLVLQTGSVIGSATTISSGGMETVSAGSATGDFIFGTVSTISGGSGVFTNETVESGGTFDLLNRVEWWLVLAQRQQRRGDEYHAERRRHARVGLAQGEYFGVADVRGRRQHTRHCRRRFHRGRRPRDDFRLLGYRQDRRDGDQRDRGDVVVFAEQQHGHDIRDGVRNGRRTNIHLCRPRL